MYVRVGSTNRHADTDLIDELRRFSRSESFDGLPFAASSSEAIDFRAASELCSGIRKLSKSDLATLAQV